MTAPVVSSLSPSTFTSGGGVSIAISGSGFTGATQVLFGTVPATSFTVVNSTLIVAFSPAMPPRTANVRVFVGSSSSAVTVYTAFIATFTSPALPAQPYRWTFLFGDLVTNTILADLPVSNVTFSNVLNDVGTFQGTIDLADLRVQAQNAANVLLPGRTAIWVDLDGVLVWGGILWTTSYDAKTRDLTIGGQSFWSYFASNRRWVWNINSSNTGAAPTVTLPLDQLTLVQRIITTVQSVTGGSINTQVGSNTSNSLISTLNVQGSQLLQVGQLVQQIAQQSGGFGFDYMIDVAWGGVNGTTPTNYLTLSYPRRGRVASLNSVTFDTGAQTCVGYTWPLDSSKQANVVYGIGSGTGTSSLSSYQEASNVLAQGYPLLESNYSRTDVNDQSTLNSITASYLNANAFPVATPTVTVSINGDPVYGAYIVGDDARIIVQSDEFFTLGLDQFWRITSSEVTVADEGLGTVKNTFSIPPATVQ